MSYLSLHLVWYILSIYLLCLCLCLLLFCFEFCLLYQKFRRCWKIGCWFDEIKIVMLWFAWTAWNININLFHILFFSVFFNLSLTWFWITLVLLLLDRDPTLFPFQWADFTLISHMYEVSSIKNANLSIKYELIKLQKFQIARKKGINVVVRFPHRQFDKTFSGHFCFILFKNTLRALRM